MKVDKIENLIPVGHRVLIKTELVEEKTAAGIVLPKAVRDQKQDVVTEGVLIAFGDMAFQDMVSEVKAIPQINSKVFYVKYSGIEFKVGDELYRVINDEDVYASERNDT